MTESLRKFRPLLATTVFLVGCAAGPTSTTQVAAPTAPPAGKALVVVYRQYAEPTAWSTTVLANSKEVASLGQKTFTWLAVAPGALQLKASWPLLSSQRDSTIDLDLVSGRVYYVEVTGVSKVVGSEVVGTGVGIRYKVGSGMIERAPETAAPTIGSCCTAIQPMQGQ
jgi:hypothetical protein